MIAEGIGYFDENRQPRARMTADGIFYYDENGTSRSIMSALGFAYADENEKPRALLGGAPAGLLLPATGAEALPTVVLVLLVDAEGNVIWRAPQ